jgi:nucleoside-diphosphate-sugar epimerase
VKTTFDGLIRSLAGVMGKTEQIRIQELAGTPGDMQGCVADLTLIKKSLGYAPAFSLAKGLEQMWNWVDAKQKA